MRFTLTVLLERLSFQIHRNTSLLKVLKSDLPSTRTPSIQNPHYLNLPNIQRGGLILTVVTS